MGYRPGGRAPYATASLIYGLAAEPAYAAYVRGKLAMAGIDLDAPLATYLDAAYAAVCDAPHDLLDKLQVSITLQSARMRPDRDTWGLLPEHVALTQKITGFQPG